MGFFSENFDHTNRNYFKYYLTNKKKTNTVVKRMYHFILGKNLKNRPKYLVVNSDHSVYA